MPVPGGHVTLRWMGPEQPPPEQPSNLVRDAETAPRELPDGSAPGVERVRLVEQTLADWRELIRRDDALAGDSEAAESVVFLVRMGQLLKAEGRWEEARGCHEEFLRRMRGSEERWESDIASALLELGEIAEQQGRRDDAWGHYEQVLHRFGSRQGPPPYDAVPAAQYRMGWLLCFQGRFDRARASFKEMMLRYGQAPEDWLRVQAVQAHRGLAHVFHAEGRMEEALASLVELSRRHGDSTDTATRGVVLRALFDLGWMYQSSRDAGRARTHYEEVLRGGAELPMYSLDEEMIADTHQGLALLDWNEGRWAESESHFQEALRRYAALPSPRCREQHCRALTNLGLFYVKQDRFEEAHRCLHEVVVRYGESSEPVLQEQVARALRTRGHALGARGLAEQSQPFYTELVRRFGESTDAAVLQEVAVGLNQAGRMWIGEARQCWKRGAASAVEDCLRHAQEMLEASLRHAPREPIVRGNLAYLAFLQGRWEEAHARLEELVREGGEEVRRALLDEVREHTFFLDEKWSELVRKLAPG
ncbi:tetratricopeptide repeat protein [Cystobacter fuscus]|uniref:tetratricopeptide repeat protein n=1 Tax=Cystobacter fuscus TaxID=43 RepID=UPI0037BFE2A4